VHFWVAPRARLTATICLCFEQETLMSASQPRGTQIAAGLVRRAHVATLHQGIVFEAVSALEMREAGPWQRLFLRHAGMLVLGAAAPDEEFRDFRNHVMLPGGVPWRGAAARAESWYVNLVTALRKREWDNVAYCTGVLGHYVIDALHPLHTAQSAAENDVHYACDVATWTQWDRLRPRVVAARLGTAVALADSPDFLSQALATGADNAHRNYQVLTSHVDLFVAPDDPAAALDTTAQQLLVGVIASQAETLAAIVARAIREAGVGAPSVALTAAGIRALVGWPLNSLARFRRRRTACATLALMRDEVRRTGHASASLTDEERGKRDLFAKELEARSGAAAINVVPFETKPQENRGRPLSDDDTIGDVIVLQRRRMPQEVARPAPRRVEADQLRRRNDGVNESLRDMPIAAASALLNAAAPMPMSLAAHDAAGLAHAAAASLLTSGPRGAAGFRDRRAAAQMQAAWSSTPASAVASNRVAAAFEAVAGLTRAQHDLLRGAG
jgi:hypothetical protein